MDTKIKIKIYSYSTGDYGCGTMFLDENDNVLGVVDENDAEWKEEYFDSIFVKIGVDVESGCFDDEDEDDDGYFKILKEYKGF